MTTSTGEPRRRRRPDERREEVAQTARDLALGDGLAALSLRSIASSMNVASGLVAHYEPSMEELTASTFRHVVAVELTEVRALVDDAPTGLDRLDRLVTTLLDPERDALSTIWADAWSLGRRMPLLARAARESMDSWHSYAREILLAAVAEGSVRTTEPDLVALELFALVDSTTAYALVSYRTPKERNQLVRRALEQALGLESGILARRA
ncbi:hypothetical protein GCM10025867_43860 [Frondihabitans sucicola]|uniref:BetI-type transcriptional repressor C-terminal domain-containing protein n=1 Tax=Frondihabitans sucicola TaxID=1268041 RepID=A0ABM8GUI9_9MICO|nr:TetR family transcriptional regulator C-terminal domain-containing protein [Frondihabitans sucicola]BDZ52145.1 hypothetical protein GCM10025867_43860 [Frondihabitans sucicola]